MGRLIVTKTKVSRTPYYMKASGHPIFSYEELCFYIKTRIALWMEEESRDGLTEMMASWNVFPEQNIDRLSPKDAMGYIFQSGTYFRAEDIEQITEMVQKYESWPEIYREKEKGDLYLSYGKSKNAYLCYWKAANQTTGEEDPSWQASLYHNLGIACCRFFYWEEAKGWFEKAQGQKESEETKNALSFTEEMMTSGWMHDGTGLQEKKLAEKKFEFLNELR